MTTIDFTRMPDAAGRFGAFGGRYVPETLLTALEELDTAYRAARADPKFLSEVDQLLREFVGRPTQLTPAPRLSTHAQGAEIWLKREDLAHTGAHKINNALGQALLAMRMGKTRIIAETGAGQHGVATATACARFGLECCVYMGSEDVRRQKLNVFRMKLMGAEVREVDSGSKTLKDATNEALRDWMGSVGATHYIIGSVVGPHPFPMIVRDFQSVIGRECRAQSLATLGRLPDCIVAPFTNDASVRLVGVEAGGRSNAKGEHAAPLTLGSPGVLHGSMSYVVQDEVGQTADVHSCSAGLDYPGVGPEHSYWKDTKRVDYVSATDDEALAAFQTLAKLEGIIPALETSHAVHAALQIAAQMRADQHLVINVSGRGDKDVTEVIRLLGL